MGKFCEQFNLQNCLPVSVSLCSAFSLNKNLIHFILHTTIESTLVSSPVKSSVQNYSLVNKDFIFAFPDVYHSFFNTGENLE